jgi:hypothetical protein
MLSLVRRAIQANKEDFELDKDIKFYAGEVYQLIDHKEKQIFDTAFVPYLLGVQNGIESEKNIVDFMRQLI